jgi:hypothetical protein
MKLENHVLKEHRVLHMIRDGKRYLLRVVLKTGPVARREVCTHPELPYYADVWNEFKLKVTRTWHPCFEATEFRGEYASVVEAIQHFKQLGFKFLHPRGNLLKGTNPGSRW